MQDFLRYQDQTSHYYGDLMNKLERMNSTLGSMLHYMDNMQGRLEDRLHIIQGYLGWAGHMCSCPVLLFCFFSVINVLKKLCAFCDFRLKLDCHVDVHCARRLLCGVCRPDDLPALPSVLSGSVAAQRASERGGRGEPATSAGPGQPQPAAARALPGYQPEEAW